MIRNRSVMLLYSVVLLTIGAGIGRAFDAPPTLEAQMKGRVFELRTYTAPDGKLSDLHKRFREHTLRIFEKHGMTNIGYWMPQDAPLSENTMIYLLAFMLGCVTALDNPARRAFVMEMVGAEHVSNAVSLSSA